MSKHNQTAHRIDALDGRTDDIKVKGDENITFSNMMLAPPILQGLTNAGFIKPSPIQLEAIPVGRCGFDLVVQAKAGTGKTVVFTVIALQSVNADVSAVQALVLAPTREIVIQIHEVMIAIGSEIPKLKCSTFIGGILIAKDKESCRLCHIAIGTPGRIKQLIQEKILNPKSVRLFVLDEADKLLDEDFQADINFIYHHLPENKQMLALSATYPEALAQFLTKYMQNSTFVRLNAEDPALLGIKQFYRKTIFHPIPQKCFENKIPHIVDILSHLKFDQCLIFSNHQMRAQNLCDRLSAQGWPATCICGKMEQNKRMFVMNQMKQFQCRILVSTDLTSRGIDVYNINLVINLDVPYDCETYLHRIGRAGRFGSYGIAISLIAEGEEENWLKDIQQEGNLKISLLPNEISSELWSTRMSNFPLLNSLETPIKPVIAKSLINEIEVNDSLSQTSFNDKSNNDQHLVVEDVSVSAGLLESLKLEENLKQIELGKELRLIKSKTRVNANRAPKFDYSELSAAVDQLISGENVLFDVPTFDDDEQDLEEFLSKECAECTGIYLNEFSTSMKEPRYGNMVKDFLNQLHATFFDNLGKDLKPLLDLDRDEELKNKLEEWMANLCKSELEIISTSNSIDDKKNILASNEISSKTIENQAPKERKKKTSKIKPEKRESLINVKQTSVINDEFQNYDSSTNNNFTDGNPHKYTEFNYYENWNQWYRNMQTQKYMIWYQEYTKAMLNYK